MVFYLHLNKIYSMSRFTPLTKDDLMREIRLFIAGTSTYPIINDWDVSHITDMSSLFKETSFNSDISGWTVGQVTNMQAMFMQSIFNQPIGGWNVSNVKDMTCMFYKNTKFNQPIGGWIVSNVTHMDYMFYMAMDFNQNLTTWEVPDPTSMFLGALSMPPSNQPKQRNPHAIAPIAPIAPIAELPLFEFIQDIMYHSLREDFIHNYLQRISAVYEEGLASEVYHYGLNCKYGVELEFQVSDGLTPQNRYTIGNKINNCIVNQNTDDFYKYQFDMNNADTIRTQQQEQDLILSTTRIQPRLADDFNEWTNFLVEVSDSYHANTHAGTPTSTEPKIGPSGFKIEMDPGVQFSVAPDRLRYNRLPTDYLPVNSRTIFFKADEVAYPPPLLYNKLTFPNDLSVNTCTVRDIVRDLKGLHAPIVDKLELVSPILVNEPFRLNGNNVPLGSLMLDNIVHHLCAHGNILFTHNDAFHIHLSKNQKTPAELLGPSGLETSREEIVGFTKLFWLFEPLLFAGHPLYKSTNEIPGYQSIQSLFTYNEILGDSTDAIFARLHTLCIRNERQDEVHDCRYLALNIMNIIEGGIGTVEIRLGHSTMDSEAVQTNIQLFQVLFHYNLYLLHRDRDQGKALFDSHNFLLRCGLTTCIPYYCNQTPEDYDTLPAQLPIRPPIGATPSQGRPFRGFFKSCVNKEYRTQIIKNSGLLFACITGSIPLMTIYFKYVNLWHSDIQPIPRTQSAAIVTNSKVADQTYYPVYFSNTLNVIILDWADINSPAYLALPIVPIATDAYTPVAQRRSEGISHIQFQPIRMFTEYTPNPAIAGLQHGSPSCTARTTDFQTRSMFNQGNPVYKWPRLRNGIANNRDQERAFLDIQNGPIGPDGYPLYQGQNQKSQTELLNYKIFNGRYLGGHKKTKLKKSKGKGTRKKNGGAFPIQDTHMIQITEKELLTPVIEYEVPIFHLNKARDGYTMTSNKEKVMFYRTSNFSEVIEPNPLLSKIGSELIQQKILTSDELKLLNEHNYVEIGLYIKNEYTQQLLGELSEILKMDKHKLQQIKNCYINVYKSAKKII